jgi:4-amino-4-deoxy-L-arabinose transferase-like glycosyltransferase
MTTERRDSVGDVWKPLVAVSLLTLAVQFSNFVVDWKALTLRDRFTVNLDLMVGDNTHYFAIATNLLSGNGYVDSTDEMLTVRAGTPTYRRSPGQPLLYAVPLAIFCRATGYQVTEANAVQVWLFLYGLHLAMLCLGGVYFYKLALFLADQRWAFLAAALYIIWPSHLVFLSPSLAKFTAETLVEPLLVVAYYLLLKPSDSVGNRILAGVVLGACLLTRVYLVLVLAALIGLSLLIRNAHFRKRVIFAAIVAALILLPWPIRNYLVFGDFSLSSQGGIQLWLGNNAEARGSIDGRMYDEGYNRPQDFPLLRQLEEKYPGIVRMAGYDETQAKDILRKEAVSWMKDHPAALARLWMKKLAITLYPANFGSYNKVNILTAGVFLLFVPGLLLYLRQCAKGQAAPEFLSFTVPVVCLCLVNVLFFAEYRTRLLMEPFMMLFAVYGAQQLWERIALSRAQVGSRTAHS